MVLSSVPPRPASLLGPTERALGVAAVLPGVPLGGWAAARLLGVDDMDGATAAGRPLPVPVCPGRSGRLRGRDEIVLLRSDLDDDDVVVVDGVPVTSPVRTAFDLARTAPDLWAAVEEVDCVFRGRSPRFLEALADYATARPRWKGVDQVRRAVPLATVLTRSRGESWLRMVWVLLARLPSPLVNALVHDGEDHHVGTPDLLDERTGEAGEYDGRGHRSAEQQHTDAVRGELLATTGLTVVTATAIDRRSPRSMARRLRAGYARALRTPRGAWWAQPAPTPR